MSKYRVEIVRHVSDGNAPLTIRPYSESSQYVELLTIDADAVNYWGKVSLTMSHEMADLLGHALIAAAAEARSD